MNIFTFFFSQFLLIIFSNFSIINSDLPKMIYVKGGEFQMGCTEEQGSYCLSDEKPAVKVKLNDFLIGKYEVTNSQYAEFLNSEGNQLEAKENWYRMDKYSLIKKSDEIFKPLEGFENHPVNNVSWYGAISYTKWLSKTTGENYRLPTEAEWEYAARGGLKNKGFVFSGSNTAEEVAWFSNFAANSKSGWGFKLDKGTLPVGQKLPNELGLYDMSGNLSEWCYDFYENYYTGGQNPKGPKYGSLRVLRGGSWDNKSSDCRVSKRNYASPTNRFAVNKGFRVLMDPN